MAAEGGGQGSGEADGLQEEEEGPWVEAAAVAAERARVEDGALGAGDPLVAIHLRKECHLRITRRPNWSRELTGDCQRSQCLGPETCLGV
jgi:hypothetical protein